MLIERNKAFEGVLAGLMTFSLFAAAAVRLSVKLFDRNGQRWI